MGARYGRNQKRRHVRQIAELGDMVLRMQGTAERQAKRASAFEDRINAWVRNLSAILGPEHIMLEKIAVQAVKDVYGDRYRADMRQPLSVSYATDVAEIEDVNLSSRVLDLILNRVRVDRDAFGPMPRVVMKLESASSGSVYYAVDPEAMEMSQRDPRFIEWVAEQLVRELNIVINGVADASMVSTGKEE